jgi:hypothetical protein
MTASLLVSAVPAFVIALLLRVAYIQLYGWVLRVWDYRLPASYVSYTGCTM